MKTPSYLLPLPLPVVAAIVHRFSNMDEIRFGYNDARIFIHDYTEYTGGVWAVSADFISGEAMNINATPDKTADFGYRISYEVLYNGNWYKGE